MFFQAKIHSCFIAREQLERFKLQKRLIFCLVKELGYYCTQQGLWLGEVDIKETLSGCQIWFMRRSYQGTPNVAPGCEILGQVLRAVSKDLIWQQVCLKHRKHWLLLFNFLLCESFFNNPSWMASYYLLLEPLRKLNLASSPHNFLPYSYTPLALLKKILWEYTLGPFWTNYFSF